MLFLLVETVHVICSIYFGDKQWMQLNDDRHLVCHSGRVDFSFTANVALSKFDRYVPSVVEDTVRISRVAFDENLRSLSLGSMN